MTLAVFQDDSYRQELTATSTVLDGERLELDQTIFYAESGGTQVKNTGEIGRVRISKIETRGRQNRRVHLVLE